VDLAARTVETIAGTGRQGRAPVIGMPAPRATPLNSPWDLLVHGGQIYVAMAGPHQIWRMPRDGSGIGVYAGNGREDVVDGPLLPKKPFATGAASFAQPSGLATDGGWLFVADSEGSSIRAVPLPAKPAGPFVPPAGRRVKTVVGTSRLPRDRLFTFGDVDGPAAAARLQHPLGVDAQQVARGREGHFAFRALKEPFAQLVFQLHDLLAERRLGDMTLLGRAAEIFRAGDGEEVAQLMELHSWCLLLQAFHNISRL
jgi:hypothetical protein